MIYKKFTLGLLILISLSCILCQPGNGVFEDFVRFYNFQNVKNLTTTKYANYYFKYPPLVQVIFTKILQVFPTAKNLEHFEFYGHPSYNLFKTILYIAYLIAFISLIFAGRSYKKVKTASYLDMSLGYFGSVSIMLISLLLTYLDIYAIPLFVISFILLLKGRHVMAAVFYTASLFTSWMMIIFAPIYLAIFLKTTKQFKFIKPFGWLAYCLIPGSLIIIFFRFLLFDKTNFIIDNFSAKTLGLYWFINQPLEYLAKVISSKIEIKIISGLVAVLVFTAANIFTGYLLKSLFFQGIKFKTKGLKILPYLLVILVIFISYVLTDSLFLPYLTLFIIWDIKLLVNFVRKGDYSLSNLVNVLFLTTCLYLLLCPLATGGNLIWLVVISLLNFFWYPKQENKLKLVLVNLFVFITLYLYFGASGFMPLKGLYFDSLRYLIIGLYIFYLTLNVTQTTTNEIA